MARVIHLNKSGSGMASKTACGRNILRTPMSADWAGFTGTKASQRCSLCDASSHAEFQRKQEEKASVDAWEPEHPDAWKAADDALIAARRAS